MIEAIEKNGEIIIVIIQGVSFLTGIVALGKSLINLNTHIKKLKLNLEVLQREHESEVGMRQRQVENLDARLGRLERTIFRREEG